MTLVMQLRGYSGNVLATVGEDADTIPDTLPDDLDPVEFHFCRE